MRLVGFLLRIPTSRISGAIETQGQGEKRRYKEPILQYIGRTFAFMICINDNICIPSTENETSMHQA